MGEARDCFTVASASCCSQEALDVHVRVCITLCISSFWGEMLASRYIFRFLLGISSDLRRVGLAHPLPILLERILAKDSELVYLFIEAPDELTLIRLTDSESALCVRIVVL